MNSNTVLQRSLHQAFVKVNSAAPNRAKKWSFSLNFLVVLLGLCLNPFTLLALEDSGCKEEITTMNTNVVSGTTIFFNIKRNTNTGNNCNPTISFKNTGCQHLEVLWNNNGHLQHYANIGPNGTASVATYVGHEWVFKVGGNTIKHWTVSSCQNSTQPVNSGGCNTNTGNNCNPTISFKNTGCQHLEILWNNNGQLRHYANIGPNGTATVATYVGHEWVFKVGGNTIKRWTASSCQNSTQPVNSGGCSTNSGGGTINIFDIFGINTTTTGGTCSPKVTFNNTGCNTLTYNSTDGHTGTMVAGKVWSANSKLGAVWTFKVGGSTIKRWSVTSCTASSNSINSGGCSNNSGGGIFGINTTTTGGTCRPIVTFKNTGCKTLSYNSTDGQSGTMSTGKVWQAYSTVGVVWTFKVNGTTVKTWTVTSCNSSSNNVNSGGCNTNTGNNCNPTISFKNTGCQQLEILWNNNGQLQHYANIGPSGTAAIATYVGHEWVFKVGGQIIKRWTVSSCQNSTESINSGGCNTNSGGSQGTTVSCGNGTSITHGNGSITMKGRAGHEYFFQIFDKRWKSVYHCARHCGSSKTANNLSSGLYRIIIKDTYGNVMCHKNIQLRNHFNSESSESRNAKQITSTITNTVAFTPKVNKLKVFPNPAQAELSINLASYIGDTGSLILTNKFGQTVQQINLETISDNLVKLNTSSLENGVYYLSIRLNNSNQIITEKVMILK